MTHFRAMLAPAAAMPRSSAVSPSLLTTFFRVHIGTMLTPTAMLGKKNTLSRLRCPVNTGTQHICGSKSMRRSKPCQSENESLSNQQQEHKDTIESFHFTISPLKTINSKFFADHRSE
jgi:hypothetical protein